MMENTNLYHSLSLIVPEIILSVALIVLVLADLIFHKDKNSFPYIALAAIAITGYFTLIQFGNFGSAFSTSDATSTDYGMFAVDSFRYLLQNDCCCFFLFIIFFSFGSDEINKIKDRIGEYYALIFGMILGMFFMISATDLILIYLSMELMSLSSYVLSGFTKLRERNSEAALKYLLYGAVSSGLMLFGISLVYGLTGSTNLYVINAVIQNPHINLFTLCFLLAYLSSPELI